MKKSGIKFLLKLATLPAMAILLAWALHTYGNYDLLVSILFGIIFSSFCAMINLWVGHSMLRSRVEQLNQGIHDHEISIARRLNSISANLANTDTITNLEKQVDYVRKKLDKTNPDHQLFDAHAVLDQNRRQTSTPPHLSADDEKVISINAAMRNRNRQSNPNNLAYDVSDIEDMIEQRQISVFLQPSIMLADNSICSYEVLARLRDEHDHLVPACQFMPLIEKGDTFQLLDNDVLDKSLKLLKKLRSKGLKPILHVNFSADSFASDEAFRKITKKLNANKSLKKQLVIEVSQNDFISMLKNQAERFDTIIKAGFKFCIDNCRDNALTSNHLKSGLVSAVKIHAATFSKLDYWSSIDDEMNLVSLAKENNVQLIVTHVEKKRQVIQLIDNNVEIAQGFLFSEPKPPENGNAKKSSSMQRKAARR